jgi:predicted transcriptional regulator of viral defense system
MTKQLELVNNLMARGHTEFTFKDALDVSHVSPTATANTLRALTKQGLVDRVTRGRYSIRPIGSLGTSVVNDDLIAAVGGAFAGRTHRIAYRSALSELGLLTHPARTIFVACTQQVRFNMVGSRPVRVVLEQPRTIHIGAEPAGRSWRSTAERALLECAMRIDLAGGVERLSEALFLASREIDVDQITRMAGQFGVRGRAGLRRIASISHTLDLNLDFEGQAVRGTSLIPIDPRDHHTEWIDDIFGVTWSITPSELISVVRN